MFGATNMYYVSEYDFIKSANVYMIDESSMLFCQYPETYHCRYNVSDIQIREIKKGIYSISLSNRQHIMNVYNKVYQRSRVLINNNVITTKYDNGLQSVTWYLHLRM